MKKRKRLGVVGLGEGGCNGVLRSAHMFARYIRRLREAGKNEYADQVQGSIEYMFMDTCDASLWAYMESIQKLGLTAVTVPIGPKSTLGHGTGQDFKVGRAAMEESIASNSVATVLQGLEAVMVKLSWGEGGTGLGGGSLLINYCRQEAKLLTLPHIVSASLTHHEVNWEQSAEISRCLQQLDDSGVAFWHLATDSLYEHVGDIPRKKAFALADQICARSEGSLVRVLADPRTYDRNNVLRQLYCNILNLRKRWLMGSVVLNLKDGEISDGDLREAVHKLLDNRFCEFDLSKCGGGMLVIEGDALSLRGHDTIKGEISAVVNRAYRLVKKDEPGNPHLHLKEAVFPNGKPDEMTLGLWMAEYTGLPKMDQLPEINWRNDFEFALDNLDETGEEGNLLMVSVPLPVFLKEAVVDHQAASAQPAVMPIVAVKAGPKPETACELSLVNFKQQVFPDTRLANLVNLTEFMKRAAKYSNRFTDHMLEQGDFFANFVILARQLQFELARVSDPEVKEDTFTYSPSGQEVLASMPHMSRKAVREKMSEDGWIQPLFEVLLQAAEAGKIPRLQNFSAKPPKGKEVRVTKETSQEELAAYLRLEWGNNQDARINLESCQYHLLFFGLERYRQLWSDQPAVAEPTGMFTSLIGKATSLYPRKSKPAPASTNGPVLVATANGSRPANQ